MVTVKRMPPAPYRGIRVTVTIVKGSSCGVRPEVWN